MRADKVHYTRFVPIDAPDRRHQPNPSFQKKKPGFHQASAKRIPLNREPPSGVSVKRTRPVYRQLVANVFGNVTITTPLFVAPTSTS